MRKLFTLAVAALISAMAWSVTPEKMSYQAVIRNSSEQLVVNKKVGMRISILQNSETGTAVYTETQTPTTNANGLVSLEIGAGKSSNNFSTVDWSKGPFFIKTETDPSGGTNYTISGVSQLLSVPYALHAKTVEIDKVDDADADPTNEIQTLSLSGTSLTLSKNGGTVTLPSSGGGDNWGTQTAVTNATLEGNGSTASPLKIAQQGATSGQTLKWNGTAWAPGNETREDTINEIQTLSLSGTSLTLSKNGGTVTLPSSGGGDNWGTQTAVTNATLEGNGSTASPLKIAQQGATAGQTLKWNGAAWAPGDDAKGTGLTLPYSESVSNTDCAFSIGNSLGSAIKGESTSSSGTGVNGNNSSDTGYTFGVVGTTSSPNGKSVYGNNFSSGNGVFGSSVSGTGVSGHALLGSGVNYGVTGSTISPDGVGVYGHNDAQSGSAIGVKGESSSSSGTGVYGTGGSCGVYGSSNNSNGVIGKTKADYASGVFGAGTGKGSSSGVYGDAGESVSPPNPGNSGVLGQANEHIGVAGTAVSGIGGYFSSYSGQALKTTGGIQLTGIGEASGKVLTSDDNGNATWQTGSSKLELPYYNKTSADEKAFSITNDLNTAIEGYSTGAATLASGVKGVATLGSGLGVFGLNLADSGLGVGVRGYSSSSKGYGVYGSGGEAGVNGFGSNYGVKGESSSQSGAGVYGTNSDKTGHNYGVMGEINSTGGTAVYGENWAQSGNAFGTVGVSYSPSGVGAYGGNGATTGDAYGVKGESSSSEGIGVYGTSLNTGVKGVGDTYGVKGESFSSSGTGVYGKGEGYGVYGSSNKGTGVYGMSSNSSGVEGYTLAYNSSGVRGYGTGSDYSSGVMGNTGEYAYPFLPGNSGVLGRANEHIGIAGTAISGIGVYGKSEGYAGYFDGRLVVNGNVGIGTDDPVCKLDVAGSINLNKGITGGAIYCNGNEALWFNGDCYSWGYGGTWNFFQRKVHIGGSNYNPAYMLYVEGDAAKSTGSSVWIIASDIRLKDIQGNYEKGLNEIIKLKPVKFNYKAGNACNLPSDQNYVGFIAQDVQKIFPEAVSEGKDGYLSLDVNSINVAIVNAVKELKAENDKLNAEAQRLKAENENLKLKNEQVDARLNQLENLIKAISSK